MKLTVYLIGNQTKEANFSITETLRKIYCVPLPYMSVCFNFHKKDYGTLLFGFLEWILLQLFQFSWLFFSISTIFLISSISLFSIYCYRFKQNKEITIISEITWFLFIRRFWKCIFKFFDYISFKYQQSKWGSHQQVKAEAIINYFIRYFESTSVDISAKRNWGCTLKLQFASWYRMLWPLENMYKRP